VACFEELKKDSPVALVKSISGKAVDIEAWDETGLYPIQLKIEPAVAENFSLKPEMTPSAIRLRSGNQVSCAFGKKRAILKKGDWLLKTANGWRNLRRSEEIDQYLHHRLRGELFVLDAIEKEQGRSMIKGHLFNASRTQMHTLALPVETEKTQNKTVRKRKSMRNG
jgi:hypothetical protein